MFNLLKRPKYDVVPVFEVALAAARRPALYAQLGVPDTFDGRFDALLMHLWPLFKAAETESRLAQALYDLTFRRMELALRESGVGDLGVGKQIRFMMKAFYGRMEAYSACESDEKWRETLRRNLYGTIHDDFDVPVGMIDYVKSLKGMQVSLDDVASGTVIYPPL